MGKYAQQFAGQNNAYIEACHKENFDCIAKYDIKNGGVFFKEGFVDEVVANIHPLYGWVKTEFGDRQNISQSPADAIENGWEYRNV